MNMNLLEASDEYPESVYLLACLPACLSDRLFMILYIYIYIYMYMYLLPLLYREISPVRSPWAAPPESNITHVFFSACGA